MHQFPPFPLPVNVVDWMAFSSFSLSGSMLVGDGSEGSLPLTSRSVELVRCPCKNTFEYR